MDKSVCECCSSKHITAHGRHAGFSHLICNDCRFEFFVREGAAADSLLYENDGDYSDDLAISGNYRDLLQWQHFTALKHIGTCKKERPSILDVGCFNGFFVKKLCDMGFDAYGVDFNKKAIEYGAKNYDLGKRIAVRDISELALEDRRYDVITLFDVIEHVEQPQVLLLGLKGLLREGGILILSTPNNNMSRRPALDYPPHHLSRYYPETLRIFLANAGFKTVRHYEQMSCYNLVRHFVGSLYRNRGDNSLRGGRLRPGRMVNVVRTALNRLMKPGHLLLYPLDRLLHACGLRYIAQIIICEKMG